MAKRPFEICAGPVLMRHLRPADSAAVQELNADPEVMQFITGPQPKDETAQWVEQVIAGYAERPNLGWFAVEEIESGSLVGLAALKRISEGNHEAMAELIQGCSERDVIEVGWRFFKAFWGRGYATATGRALVELGFREHDLPRVIAMALVENLASCRAIQKCGLNPYGDYEILGRTARMFVITRAEWQAKL
jgi:ribosomal-protein-alanine N-acetyltransferase